MDLEEDVRPCAFRLIEIVQMSVLHSCEVRVMSIHLARVFARITVLQNFVFRRVKEDTSHYAVIGMLLVNKKDLIKENDFDFRGMR